MMYIIGGFIGVFLMSFITSRSRRKTPRKTVIILDHVDGGVVELPQTH